jgi:hypothetical protein
MNTSLPKVKIYTPVIDEFRPVTTSEEKSSWEKRMKNECGQIGFKITGDMQLLDTCCGGSADDCGHAF